MKKRIIVASVAAAALLGSSAKINSPAPTGYLDRAVMMFDDENYNGCLDQLDGLDSRALTHADRVTAAFYRAIATVHTDKTLAIKLLRGFIADYPESGYIPRTLLALGDCYYGSDYTQALEIYLGVPAKALDEALIDDLTYRMAYCYMETGRLTEANTLFEDLGASAKYANAALFYRGYIAYTRAKVAQAEKLFAAVDTSTPPGNMADYYLCQISFMRDDYAKALKTAKSLLRADGVGSQFIAEANRIAGESAYHLGDYAEAVGYLKKYASMVEVPIPSAAYILGLDAYNAGDYSTAVDYLAKVTDNEDAMGQSAYLYLGQAYLHLDDYTAAAMAFNRALNMDYDQAVRETAYYNYAVATLGGGKVPFVSSVKTFTDFLTLFPRSTFAPDVQEYIITTYLTDNNYEAALQSINGMSVPTDASLAAKQRVLYVLGNRALVTGDDSKALDYLEEAAKLSKYDAATAREVSLALGEAYYRAGNYDKAVAQLRRYIETAPASAVNLPLARYDLGYAYFARKEYGSAAKQFEAFLKDPGQHSTMTVADAYNRLGDCEYYAKNFAAAAQAYDNAYLKNPTAGDYSLYQKALMAGYNRDYNQKINTLARLEREFPASALIPDALLETTESYIQLGNRQGAIDVYRRLVEKYPNTAQGRQGYLQMALVRLNTGDRTGAIADYKEVIRRYPTSDEAQQAVEQMKRICAQDGTLADFTAFLKTVGNAPQIDESEVEQLTFETAEHEFLAEGRTDRLESFIEEYDQSNQRARALSYLMEGMYGSGDADAAYEYAEALIEQYPSSSYVPQALAVKADIEEVRGKNNQALRTWQQLLGTASSPDLLHRARMGVLRTGRDSASDTQLLDAANSVISTAGVGADDLAEAYFVRGYVNNKAGKTGEARKDWEKIAGDLHTRHGIEAAYNIGESYLASGNNAKAEEWAKAVANADSPFYYWIARGFILLSDVYTAQGDNYKARQYLEAVRDNYTGTENDIFQMIDQRLK